MDEYDDLGLNEGEYPQEDMAVNPFLAFTQFDAVQKKFELSAFTTKKVEDIKYVEGSSYIQNYYNLDVGRSCKFFQTKDTQKLIFKLDPSALRLLLFILSKLGRKSDRIKIETAAYMKLADIQSTKTFYSALNNLRLNGVIAKFQKNVFWVNPNVIFSGNRLEKYPDKVNIVKHAEKPEFAKAPVSQPMRSEFRAG